jgi:hypothetical protein
MKQLLIVLFLITLISCNTNRPNKDFEKPFIKSYEELNDDCTNIISEILEPYEFGNDTLIISKTYKLDVIFDSTLYSKEDLLSNYFIGIKFKPDLYELIVLNIDFKIGTITTCQILPNESLIINNMVYLFTDLTNLGKCEGLGIADTLVEYTANRKTMFRHKAWTNTMYGTWKPESSGQRRFKNERFNNLWVFKPEKGFLLININKDTLLVDDIDLQGEYLQLKKSEFEFEIATQSKTKILIRESGTEDFLFLNKIND